MALFSFKSIWQGLKRTEAIESMREDDSEESSLSPPESPRETSVRLQAAVPPNVDSNQLGNQAAGEDAVKIEPDDEETHYENDERTKNEHENYGYDNFEEDENDENDNERVDYNENEDSTLSENDLQQQMQEEKKLYPEASTWAPDEERLFEILFLRAYRPLLPFHWELDFRGVPMPSLVFNTSQEHPAVVYAHKSHFNASYALTRLIDLTADIRTTKQSNLRREVPKKMKRGLDGYVNWAAEDGGFKNLRIVPNLIVELLSLELSADGITEYMKRRMGAAAKLQREFWKLDRDTDFWETTMPELMNSKLTFNNVKVDVAEAGSEQSRKRSASEAGFSEDGIDPEDPIHRSKDAKSTKHQRVNQSSLADDLPVLEPPQTTSVYRRQPPIVYGLFILNALVFILSVDPSKGENSPVSFHVQIDFEDRHQSVWNALTVAIVTCQARDELMSRTKEFDHIPEEVESDPDA